MTAPNGPDPTLILGMVCVVLLAIVLAVATSFSGRGLGFVTRGPRGAP